MPFFFSQDHFAYFRYLVISNQYQNCFLLFLRAFGSLAVLHECVDGVGWYGHLTFNYSNPRPQDVFPFICIFFNSKEIIFFYKSKINYSHMGTSIRLLVNFSTEILLAGKDWDDILKVPKEKKNMPTKSTGLGKAILQE